MKMLDPRLLEAFRMFTDDELHMIYHSVTRLGNEDCGKLLFNLGAILNERDLGYNLEVIYDK